MSYPNFEFLPLVISENLTGLSNYDIFKRMSAQEIIAELSNLKADELRLVREKLTQLEAVIQESSRSGWGEALSEIVAAADDLPDDLSLQHDHYLYGSPKQ